MEQAAAVPSGFNSGHYNSSLLWVSGKTVSLDLTVLDLFSFVLVAIVLFKRKLSFSSAFIS